MTDPQPPRAAPTHDPGAPGPNRSPASRVDEDLRVPDWMRQVGTEQVLDRSERRRLAWGRHRGKLLVAVVALGAAGLLGATAVVVGTVTEGVRTATAPTPAPFASGPRDYFAGTPAAGFAVGERGIALPPARATGPFSEAQVRAALDTTRRALVESRLADTMLRGDPGPFLAVLAEDARTDLTPLLSDSRRRLFTTQFAREYRRVDEIRVSGKVSYQATEDDSRVRVLAVTTRFSWVYAFERLAGEAPPEANLVVVRDTLVWQFPHPDDVVPGARGLWLASAEALHWNAMCDELGQTGRLDVEPGRYRSRGGPAGRVPLTEVFDPERAARVPGTC
ncbi:hypothetical protein E1258_27060 [Micromonospora sp. KC207]|uniref:hypothetical protein n=1 Tax=Micromonospora sp. KC207 TaxID=2530377 RepID=UPI00104FD37D|nr:hypothetical protein [Micromonospora sp. KC207]TDC49590.1 hypothetical protein E1258_27060 [Micromonospora sp. KC207]